MTSHSLEELEELFAARVDPESWLARVGAPRLTDANLEAIEGSYRKIESAAEARDRAAYVTPALEYTLLCYEAASVRAILDRSLEYVATRPVVLQRSRETDA